MAYCYALKHQNSEDISLNPFHAIQKRKKIIFSNLNAQAYSPLSEEAVPLYGSFC